MQNLPNSAQRSRRPSLSSLCSRARGHASTLTACLGLLSGCGGVIQFSDSAAFAIRGPAPAPVVAEAPKRVEVKADRIEINEKIQFEIDKADIKSESHSLLNEIVQVLRDNPQIKKVDVNGHTDDDGPDNYNQDLSGRRAKSVVEYLTGHGIDASRLMSKGFGESKPIADNATSAGREKNRRVEFLIVEQASDQGVLSAQGN
jgi:outer membrane protein OmpA-like peptidoglycan-associated protein